MAGVVVSNDVIAKILPKLPVKSLLRFNCVCKTWYCVISDPQFSNNLHQMRPSVLICENLREFSTITIESLLTIKNRAPTPLSLPWETEPMERPVSDDKNLFLGSCNGLVCVDHKSKSSPDRRSGLILWNPSTRKFRRLPRPGCYSVQDELGTYSWLGYDESIDDYKLIWLNCSWYGGLELDVFTLKSNTWRSPPVDYIALRGIELFKSDRFNPKSIGVLSNGAIHWIIHYFSEVCILALDLATEKFRLLKFSHAPLEDTTWVGSLFGGCLCLCFSAYEDGCRVRDLWVMKEYGVESSWTKLLSIPLAFIRLGFQFLRFSLILFSEEEDKEILAVCDSLCEQSGGAHRAIVKLRVEGAKKVSADGFNVDKKVVLQNLQDEAIRDMLCGQNAVIERKASLASKTEVTGHAIVTNIRAFGSDCLGDGDVKSLRRSVNGIPTSRKLSNNRKRKSKF